MSEAIERWTSRDFPVLHHIVEQFEQQGLGLNNENIAEATGLSQLEVVAAARNLERGRYVSVQWFGDGFFITDISERALREVGAWPNAETTADALIWFLEQRVEAASSADERGRWTKIRDAFASAGRDITVEVAAAVAAKSMGL